MTITLNGTKCELEEGTSMTSLLKSLELGGRPVVVEQNQKALLPKEIGESEVKDGDVIEIVQITAGG